MKTLFFTLILTFAALSNAQVTTPMDLGKVNKNCQTLPTPSSVEGRWYVGESTDPQSGITFHMSFVISKMSTTSVLMCQGPGWNLAAKVTTPSAYTGNSFAINGGGFDQSNQGGANCQLNIEPMSLSYTFSGGCLVMQDPQSGQSQLLYPIAP